MDDVSCTGNIVRGYGAVAGERNFCVCLFVC